MLSKVLIVLLAYLLGSIPSAYICGKAFAGINIMEHGSGNVGTTNTFRVLGWKIGILVFVMDMGKGVLAAWFGSLVGGMTLAVICAVVAVLGHTFSVFLHFKGGKGVATGAGALLFLAPLAFILAIAVWLVLAFATGYISVASVIAALSSIVFVVLFSDHTSVIVFVTVCSLYIAYKHIPNMKRLAAGTENKVDLKSKLFKK
ncbi:MAG: glycerol-3-phosphate 1-O-acyltransferase PlsY [Bacillota bacterium]|nr:glycerol-3-phosphate 1-O-acyltransferase PlsY [Bacillota bacterium]